MQLSHHPGGSTIMQTEREKTGKWPDLHNNCPFSVVLGTNHIFCKEGDSN